jgi:hypothetical protein
MPTRRRRPVKPATIFGWQHALNRWNLPNIGDKLLSEISNGALRELIEKMAAGLSPKTIVNYAQVVKMVMASAVDADGDELYPRKWNHDFIGLPIVRKEEQHRPSVTETELGEILWSAKKMYAVLFALLAGTGLRIGEALALIYSRSQVAVHWPREISIAHCTPQESGSAFTPSGDSAQKRCAGRGHPKTLSGCGLAMRNEPLLTFTLADCNRTRRGGVNGVNVWGLGFRWLGYVGL